MSVKCSTNSVFIPRSITFCSLLSRLPQQLRHPQQIICSSDPPSRELGSLGSLETRFSKPSHRLDPTKYLFDSLSYPLTHTVARMTNRSPIDGRSSSSLGIGRHVRSNPSAAQKIDKVVGLIAFIGSQSFHPESLSSLTLEHPLGGFPLRAPRGLADFKINQQSVSILHQGMRPVTQLSLFARPLRISRLSGSVLDSWVSLLRFSP
jgi:hypothetical protein